MSSCFGKGWPIRMIRIVCQKFVALNCPLYNRGIFQKMRITINCHQSLLSLKKANGKKQWKCFQDYLPPTSSFFIGPWTQVYACQSLTLSQICSMTGSRSIRWNIVCWQQALWIIIIALLFCEFELMQRREERWRLFATREKMWVMAALSNTHVSYLFKLKRKEDAINVFINNTTSSW